MSCPSSQPTSRLLKQFKQNHKCRPFLKWAGGKFRLTEQINACFPKGKNCLIEPFVGAGSVFLNSQFERYILVDINADLINLFNLVKQDVEAYISASRQIFFHPEANQATYYYAQRARFNASQDPFERSIIFLYLNRFGFNGLCRYNSRYEFNVPFGRHKIHYFPEAELYFFAEKAQRAEFICGDFQKAFQLADKDSVIYCDPPYAPLLQQTNFTRYSGNDFSEEDQIGLATLARITAQEHNIPVVISNHDTPFTRKIYKGAKLKKLQVNRFISQHKEKRVQVSELLAIFNQYSSR